ncbi:zinc finger protein GLIS2 homolog [Bacillus rossius redtenbacheri]|uniref:zinc finger protein GLIS2 homolog n=1 Tax=Bacillus rossius redtenbacheri TaxID=93214 RepID=UPI002FDE4242
MGTLARCCAPGAWQLSRAEPRRSSMGETPADSRAAALLGLQNDTEASNSSVELSSELDHISLRDKYHGVKCRWAGCGLWLSQLEALAVHVTRVHAAAGLRGLFYCGWQGCARGDRGFNARYKMLVHVRTHTNEKPHHCYKCDKSFSRAENLKIHARSHTGERPYVCPVPGCGKAYSNSSDRFKHTRTHSVDKPYCCKVPGCPKRYTDPSSLRKHVKTYRHLPDAPEEEVGGAAGRTEWLGGRGEEDARYGLLLRSWLRGGATPPLPWGVSMWAEVSSDELPLDLTVHRAGTVT